MTTNTKKKKSAREKRVIVASLIVAAVMIGGSTFAWFTSKDEVTNRLSANAKYDVSIVEDFQPPEDWIPGPGNVDAFVRMWLGGQMRLLNETTGTGMVDIATSTGITADNKPSNGLTQVTDKDMLALGLTWQKTEEGSTPVYYRTLSTKKIDNALDVNHATLPNEETNNPATFSEVQSVQAGGVLVYAPTDAQFSWTLEQATEMKTFTGDGDITGKVINIAKDTVVGTYGTPGIGQAISSNSSKAYYGAIDASTFQPKTEGLYLFRRNVNETPDGTANTYEYSGYYYVPASGTEGQEDYVPEQYFALHTDEGANGKSDYVLPSGVIKDNSTAEPSKDQVLPVTIEDEQKVYLYTATEKVLDTGSDKLSWKYEDEVTDGDNKHPARFVVSYGEGDKAIVINVNLANIGDTSEAWTVIKDNATNPTQKTTFYYNNDVEAGDTTRKLVDSVELSKDTKNGAYLAFDFDLNVFLDSVQVTMDENGDEGFGTVSGWAAGTDNVGATAATAGSGGSTVTAGEIVTIKWNDVT